MASIILGSRGRCLRIDLDRRMQAQMMDAALVGLSHFKPPAAGVEQYLADLRHMACEDGGEAAQRVDILVDLGEPRVDRLADIVEFGARIGFPTAAGAGNDQRFGFVVVFMLHSVVGTANRGPNDR